jgi:hypothetical protein
MAYTPTTAELRDAFRRGRLWWLGWTFQKAQSVPYVAQALANQVRAERARIEQQQGKPAPVQPALFERTA